MEPFTIILLIVSIICSINAVIIVRMHRKPKAVKAGNFNLNWEEPYIGKKEVVVKESYVPQKVGAMQYAGTNGKAGAELQKEVSGKFKGHYSESWADNPPLPFTLPVSTMSSAYYRCRQIESRYPFSIAGAISSVVENRGNKNFTIKEVAVDIWGSLYAQTDYMRVYNFVNRRLIPDGFLTKEGSSYKLVI